MPDTTFSNNGNNHVAAPGNVFVFRLEDHNAGVAPTTGLWRCYAAGGAVERLCAKHKLYGARHPAPHAETGELGDLFSGDIEVWKHYAFAFENRSDFRLWWGASHAMANELRQHGDELGLWATVYEVPADAVVKGRWQAAFDSRKIVRKVATVSLFRFL
jgi:hypothetical protein